MARGTLAASHASWHHCVLNCHCNCSVPSCCRASAHPSTAPQHLGCQIQQVLHPCLSPVLSPLHPAILTYLLFLMCTDCSMFYALRLLFPFPRRPFHIFLSRIIPTHLLFSNPLWPPTRPHFPSSWSSGFTSSVKS